MSWLEQLQPASFRGVPFQVEDGGQGLEFGRRAFSVEYPYRDSPFVDDMGRRLRIYTLEAFLIETKKTPDLFAQRKALIDALEKSDPATLVHPRFGPIRVQVDRGRWRTDQRGSNVERFSIDFLEASSDAQPLVQEDTLTSVLVAADAVDVASGGLLDKAMALKDQAEFVVSAARDSINKGMDGVKKLVRIGTAAADIVSSVKQTIQDAVEGVKSLILLPRSIAASVCGLIQTVLGIDGQIETALSGYRAISVLWGATTGDGETPPGSIPLTDTPVTPLMVSNPTPSRIAQATNDAAVAQLFKTAAAVAAVRIVASQASSLGVTDNADSPFRSAEEAYAVRDELVSALDAIADNADTDLYAAITVLQSAFIAHIDAHGNTLPRVSRVALAATLPMLVIAHRIDGNIDREADLIARNHISHSLFVPAGKELEVLHG